MNMPSHAEAMAQSKLDGVENAVVEQSAWSGIDALDIRRCMLITADRHEDRRRFVADRIVDALASGRVTFVDLVRPGVPEPWSTYVREILTDTVGSRSERFGVSDRVTVIMHVTTYQRERQQTDDRGKPTPVFYMADVVPSMRDGRRMVQRSGGRPIGVPTHRDLPLGIQERGVTTAMAWLARWGVDCAVGSNADPDFAKPNRVNTGCITVLGCRIDGTPRYSHPDAERIIAEASAPKAPADRKQSKRGEAA